jgi:hypothetical protein
LAKINPTIAAKDRHDHGDQDRLGLLRPDRCNGTITRLHHFGTNGVDFFIEFIAEHVDSRKAASERCEISRIDCVIIDPETLFKWRIGKVFEITFLRRKRLLIILQGPHILI